MKNQSRGDEEPENHEHHANKDKLFAVAVLRDIHPDSTVEFRHSARRAGTRGNQYGAQHHAYRPK